jgi:hypothetical protein
MKSYLSIDLDYFFYEGFEIKDKFLEFMETLNKLCDSKNIKPSIVKYHHELLPIVDKYSFDNLLHIDFHSDLTDYNKEDLYEDNLNEGTWINFVKKRKNIDFIWYGTSDNEFAYCDKFNVLKEVNRDTKVFDPFDKKNLKKMGFKSISKKFKVLPSKKMLDTVKYVGISISPNWIENKYYNLIAKTLRKYKFIDNNFTVEDKNG